MAGLRQFWLGWRKEIVRGGLTFSAVIVGGLVVMRAVGGFARDFDFRDFASNFEERRGGREWTEAFRWVGTVAPNRWIWIRNTNGPIIVEQSDGDSIIIEADKSAQHSDPELVEIRTVERDGALTVCAMWPAAHSECGSEGQYRLKDVHKNDVAVRFRVFLPKGARLDASTVNGPVSVAGAPAALALRTVNGRIAATATGPITANTVNGGIHAVLRDLSGTEPVVLKTVNGTITAELPSRFDADLEASTVSGRVTTELPIQIVGRVSPRQVKARIGAGGRRVALNTVNGSITITESHPGHDVHVAPVADAVSPAPPAPPTPPTPAAPRTPRPARPR
jgi:hypothetical protein